MTKAIAKKDEAPDAGAIEKVLLQGDLSALTEEQRVGYYKQVCDSIGLNPLTKPFDYIKLNGKLTLYALKGCTDQLRQIYGVSIDKPDIQELGGNFVVTVRAQDKTGRMDSDVGVVSKSDMNGNFGNALMKAITKAKRRVTLSICGLGMLDETEVETIPSAQPFRESPAEPLKISAGNGQAELRKAITDLCAELNKAGDDVTWNKRTLDEFCNDFFSDGEGFGGLTDKDLETLKEELEERLKAVSETAQEIEGEVV